MNKSNKFLNSIQLPLYFLMLIWVIFSLQSYLLWDFGHLGIFPRKLFGAKGIILAPLIHSDLKHIVHNSIPLFVLSSVILFFYKRVAIRSFIAIYLLTGIMVWLIGNFFFCGIEYGNRCNSYHIGASGVVYGLATFIMGSGIFRRNIKSIVLSLIVLFYYSGMFTSILPMEEGISWESHLYGGIMGLFVAFYFKDEIEEDEKPKPSPWENDDNSKAVYFLPNDIFEKTKEERRIEAEQKKRSDDWTSSNTFE